MLTCPGIPHIHPLFTKAYTFSLKPNENLSVQLKLQYIYTLLTPKLSISFQLTKDDSVMQKKKMSKVQIHIQVSAF